MMKRCEHCHTPFTPKQGHQRYCTVACKRAVENARGKVRYAEQVKARARERNRRYRERQGMVPRSPATRVVNPNPPHVDEQMSMYCQALHEWVKGGSRTPRKTLF